MTPSGGARNSGGQPRRTRKRAQRVSSALVQHLPLGIFAIEARGRQKRSFTIAAANLAGKELTGLPAKELRGRDATTVFATRDGADLIEVFLDVLQSGEPRSLDNVYIETVHGETGDSGDRTHSMRIFRADRRTLGVSVEDVTDQVAATAALNHRVLHDPLTGLPNRVLFLDRLRHGLRERRRDDSALALMLLDLNQFKEVNDRLGHHHGDRLLASVGSRFRDVLRECDTVARLGGDEFAVLLTDGAGVAGARAVADKVVACLEEPFDVHGMAIKVQTSIGIALSPDHGDDDETLMRRADVAMYAAKRSGGGVALYEPELDRSNVRRLSLATDLARAIESDELRLAYQPILEIATRRVLRVEALVRWQHPTLGLLPPKEFIDLASLSGMMRPLANWVIDRSLSQCAEWRSLGIDLGVSVNLSAHNLFDVELPGFIASRLDALGLDGHSLTVEVSEADLMEDPRAALHAVRSMLPFGVRASLDDFGTGSSSFGTLQDLPICEIKIDGSFIARLADDDSTSAAVVRSIADLGRSLGVDVVAEGVQSATALSISGQLGCHLAQGYHIGPPMSAGAVGLVAAATQEPATVDLRED